MDLVHVCRISPDYSRLCREYLPGRIWRDYGITVAPEDAIMSYVYINRPTLESYIEARISGHNTAADYLGSFMSLKDRIRADGKLAHRCIRSMHIDRCADYIQREYLIAPVEPGKELQLLAYFVYLSGSYENEGLFEGLYKGTGRRIHQKASVSWPEWFYYFINRGNKKIQTYIAEYLHGGRANVELGDYSVFLKFGHPEFLGIYFREERIDEEYLEDLRKAAQSSGKTEIVKEVDRLIG